MKSKDKEQEKKNQDLETDKVSIEKLEKEIESLNKELTSFQEQYQKALNTAAYHENLSKYNKAEKDRIYKYRSGDLAERLLPVLDGFQMAFLTKSSSSEVEAYKQGFEFILKLLKNSLEAEGIVEIIPNVGDEFDSYIHHAVETVETEDDKQVNKIAKILLSGYKLYDRVLRTANVCVYIKKQEKLSEDKTKQEESIKEEPLTANEQKNKEEEVING